MKNLDKSELVHPGKIVEEKMNELGITQKELAVRTEVSEKHVWTIINCQRDISAAYAKKLEYVFNNVEPGYFYKLQLEYDLKKHNEEEANDIDEEEKAILKQLKEQIEYIIKHGQDFVNEGMTELEQILGLRKFLGFSKLTNIKATTEKIAYRMTRSSNITINQYVTYMWVRICEYYGERILCNGKLDKTKLKQKIPEIKKLMLQKINVGKDDLVKIFAECGIRFDIVKNFKGAPSQGFIKMLPDGTALLCVTIRGKRADTFWFTLFHEIAHILNGDVDRKLIDLQGAIGEKETLADEKARNFILDDSEYKKFIDNGNYNLSNIEHFCSLHNIPEFMLIGRMQKENVLEYSEYHDQIPLYSWVEN